MDIENKTLEILDLVREKVLSPDEALPHILRLFGVIGSVCDCGRREINVLSGICDICWNEKFPDEQTDL